MKPLTIFLFLFVAFRPAAFAQQYDTSRIAVLPLDTTNTYMKDLFPPNCRSASLSDKEILRAETDLKKAVDDYNAGGRKKRKRKPVSSPIDLRKYKRQYIAAYDQHHDKVILINCFCTSPETWRKEVVFAFGGGSCFFRVTLHNNKKGYYDFHVNGSK